MAGAKGKLTKELIAGIAEAVRNDMPNIEACALFYIGESTFYEWKAKGESDLANNVDSLYAAFTEAIKKAESDAIERGLACIRKASEGQWQAGAWILERCYRKRFSIHGDMFEKLEKKLNDLEDKIMKRGNKSVGAKANGSEEMDSRSDQKKGSSQKGITC